MNLNTLRYFDNVYRTKSFSEAARRIPISTQGLSQAIGRLEKELGVALFETDANGNKIPTNYADALLKFSEIVELGMDGLQSEIDRLRAQECKLVRVATAEGILGWLGGDFFSRFQRENPGISVTAIECSDYHTDELLLANQVDIGFTKSPFDKRLINFEFPSLQMYAWVHKSNHLANLDLIKVEDLQGQNVALPGNGYKIYDEFKNACQNAGLSDVEVTPLSEMFWIYDHALIDAGIGLTTEPLTRIACFSKDSNVLAIPINLSMAPGISYSRTRLLKPHELKFLEYSQKEIAAALNAT